MKRKAKALSIILCSISMLSCFSACSSKEVFVEDTHPYTFTNVEKFVAVPDSFITLDGKFEESQWKNQRWLKGVDKISDSQYANVSFTTLYGEKGIYFGITVEEFGTNIFVNLARNYEYNSCIEMYMAPFNDAKSSERMFEFDFVANGSYKSKLNYNGWTTVLINGDKMPVIKSTLIGGEVNTPECRGYNIEAFFPYGYLEFAGYFRDSTLQDLVLGIDPVHIFSFDYEGKDRDQCRKWSQWSANYLPVKWQVPSSYFKFDKGGLVAYDYTVKISGTGKGEVKELSGNDYILPGTVPKFDLITKNGSKLGKVLVNGVDMTSLAVRDGSVYHLQFSEAITTDLEIEAVFNL